MTRVDRLPIEHAAKEWKKIGDLDGIGTRIDTKKEEGLYYL